MGIVSCSEAKGHSARSECLLGLQTPPDAAGQRKAELFSPTVLKPDCSSELSAHYHTDRECSVYSPAVHTQHKEVASQRVPGLIRKKKKIHTWTTDGSRWHKVRRNTDNQQRGDKHLPSITVKALSVQTVRFSDLPRTVTNVEDPARVRVATWALPPVLREPPWRRIFLQYTSAFPALKGSPTTPSAFYSPDWVRQKR